MHGLDGVWQRRGGWRAPGSPPRSVRPQPGLGAVGGETAPCWGQRVLHAALLGFVDTQNSGVRTRVCPQRTAASAS